MAALVPVDGLLVQAMTVWNEFHEFVEERLPRAHEFIWRGHKRSEWQLEPTLDRVSKRFPVSDPLLRETVLEDFRYAIRGRRGTNPRDLDEVELWALGQHFGLATPLLDWTKSPFAAAFFAFEDEDDATDTRVVYGLHRPAVDRVRRVLEESGDVDIPVVEILLPLMDENARLVSQGGMFTKAPEGMTIEEWVTRSFPDHESSVLVRIEIPDVLRETVLKSLNRMNINTLSLFPDLDGAARYVNMSQLISDY